MNEALAIAAAALAGYLVGSISFARVIGHLAAPTRPLGSDTLTFGADGAVVEVQGVSATSVSVRAGRRWGFVVALLDIGKAAAVTLAARLLDPTGDAYLVAAGFAVVGHVWPVWHGFRGGFGVSPIIGGLLVVDPLAIPATIVVGMVLGVLLADRLIVYDGWTVLLVPWFLFVREDPPAALYAAFVVAIYWWAMRDEVRDHVRRLRTGPRGWRDRFADIRAGYTGDPRVG
jgi:acyl phosphate:glycerol-3-phosphate acyltransferase